MPTPRDCEARPSEPERLALVPADMREGQLDEVARGSEASGVHRRRADEPPPFKGADEDPAAVE